MIKNIIFDMDGTLADTAKATILSFEKYVPYFGFDPLSSQTIKNAIGYANPEFYYLLYPDQDKKKLIGFSELVEAYENIVICALKKKILFDDINTLLMELKAKGSKLYIASTGSLTHVECVLKSAGIIDLFEKISCEEPEKVSMVQKIMEATPSTNWLMVGDKQKDSYAAKINHILSVGAGYGYCVPEDYYSFDIIIQKPHELLNILETFD